MRSVLRLAAVCAAALLLGLWFTTGVAYSQAPAAVQPVSPFTIIGFMQKASLDPACTADVFCGGSMVVNGITITVPRNTMFQFPATGMTWQEMFALAPAPYGLNSVVGPQSGLALTDTPVPFATYEVTVIGNRVNDQYIAALIFLSQQSLNTADGYINYIDYATGELWIGSTLNTKTGARVKINTPHGRFGRAWTNDPRFTVDEDNPTIHAATGYPMCVPRVTADPAVPGNPDDPLCPQKNRVKDPVTGAYQTIFTMLPTPLTNPPGPDLGPTAPDPTQQAPFEIGDYVTYSGTLARDPLCTPSPTNTCQYVSAHTIDANLGIFTWPGTMPAYLSIEEMLLGVAGFPNPLFPQEAKEKLVMVATTTDPFQLVDIYAVDVDACGRETNRFYTTADPFGPPLRGAKKGRARVRTTIGDFLPATREMRVVSRTLTQGQPIDAILPTAKTYANGLVAGQYHAPNFTYIFPENLIYGGPPVPLPFQEFPFLVNGMGPYLGKDGVLHGNLGQLSPWPGLTAPAPQGCGPTGVLLAPVADAGPAQTVNSGATVILDGTASSDPNQPPMPLSYTWIQTAGPSVVLQDNAFPHPFFTAPTVPVGSPSVTLTFSLVVSNGFASSGIASVTVTVIGARNPVANAGANQTVSAGLGVILNGTATDPNGAAGQPLRFQWTQTSGPAVVLNNANTATASFQAPSPALGQPAVTLTFQLTVTNALGLSGSANTTVTVNPIPDTVVITNALWTLRQSRLRVTAASSVTNGAPVLTCKVFGFPDVVMTFDPLTRTYSTPLEGLLINPAPAFVTVVSSFGGTATSFVTIK